MGAAAEDQTVTAAEHTAGIAAAVEAALAQSAARIAELEASAEQSEVEQAVAAAVATATAELTAKVAELEANVDAADAAKKVAEDTLAATVAYLQAEAETETATERREARAAEVKALDVLTDERFEASKDRWAALTDEEWAAQLAEYQDWSARKGVKTQPVPKERPALASVTDEPGERPSAVRAVMEMRRQGIDTRKITVS